MRLAKLSAILILAAGISGCGSGTPAVTVSLSPLSATVLLAGTQQFSGTVAGASDTTVTWLVCNPADAASATGASGTTIVMPTGCVTGNAKLGNITTAGLYTAPATLPKPPIVGIVATSEADTTVFAVVNVVLDSGVRVNITPTQATVGTTEQLQLTATVTGTQNSAVNWAVNQIANGNTTNGTITPTACSAPQPPLQPDPNTLVNQPGTSVACFTAPVTGGTAGITATSAVDSRQSGSASLAVQPAADPTLTSIEPTTAVEGLLQEDVYLTGSSFFSTNTVLVNGAPVPTVFVNGTTLHAILPATFFANPSPSSLSITVQRQNGGSSQPQDLTIEPTRPAIVASVPAGIPLGASSGTVGLIGGYFSPSTTAAFQGQSALASLTNSRQFSVTLSGTDLSTPGLFPVLLQNSDVPAGSPSLSSANVAIAPPATAISPAPLAPIAVGTQPSAVAIDSALGIAVVVNKGSSGSAGSVLLIDLTANPPAVVGTPIPVGNNPTSVGVDDLLHVAAVVNSTDNTVSIVNLQSQTASAPFALPSNPTGISPPPATPQPLPYSIGVNPLTHRAVVAYSSTNIAAILDLSTNPPTLVCLMGGSNSSMPDNCAATPNTNTLPVSTGPSPSISVDPQLNWAIITPGGLGAITLVDLGTSATASQVARTPNVVASLTLSTNVQGVAVDPETNQALLTNPNQTSLTLFSELDQTIQSVTLDTGEVASAINPLTDIGVVVNALAGTATVVDLRTLQKITSVTVGTSPQAVAIDPGSNQAVIANQGSGTVSVLPLGALGTPQVTEISPVTAFSSPSSGPLTLTVNGFGFASGATVRLDGTAVPTVVSANGREATATVPGTMLASPERYSVDVLNPGALNSNEKQLTIIGAVPIGLNPVAVAVDPYLDEAFVTSQGQVDPITGACSTPGKVSVVNLLNASVSATYAVGLCPEGIATLPWLERAVVANAGSNTAMVIDYKDGFVVATLSVGDTPMGVAIQPNTGVGVITNNQSNSISLINVANGTGPTATIPIDLGPTGVSVDPIDNLAAVSASTQNTVDIVNLADDSIQGRLNGFQNPTDISFDPITDSFLVANSLQNNLDIVDPIALLATPLRVGIDPTAVAYNLQSSTAVTVNRATNTMSVASFLATKNLSVLNVISGGVQSILPMGGSAEFSVAIDSTTNVAAVVDQANGRLLLVPLPR